MLGEAKIRDSNTERYLKKQTLRGSFSAQSTATIATKYSFVKEFFEIYKILILLHRSNLKISANKHPNFCRNESKISFFIRAFR